MRANKSFALIINRILFLYLNSNRLSFVIIKINRTDETACQKYESGLIKEEFFERIYESLI